MLSAGYPVDYQAKPIVGLSYRAAKFIDKMG